MYIKVNVVITYQPRYRTRKGEVATNVLNVCGTKRDFVFMLVGKEGSTADSRIRRDVISRPNGLKVPNDNHNCYSILFQIPSIIESNTVDIHIRVLLPL